jgi:hypothetical protein
MAEPSSHTQSSRATASGAPTVREMDARPVEDGVLHLIVMGANLFSMHPLPESGAVSIGRDENDDVRIDEPNASRHHARLHVGTVLEIEDMGSTNGTRLRGNLLQPGQRAPVLPGEAISIGWATLMIQRRRPSVRVRRLPTHAYFEGRLEEECDKASTSGRVFAVLRLHVAPGTSPEAVGEIVSPYVRPGDVLASYGPDEYEMILFEHDAKRVDDFSARIVALLGARNVAARTGIAFFPGDARTADGLIARACERVQGRNVSSTPSSDDIRCGPEMRRVHLLAKRAAISNINVLIGGETGVGKEVLAEIIHGLSPRAQAPFLRINCATLSPTLFEAELFGHERAAFTDAREAAGDGRERHRAARRDRRAAAAAAGEAPARHRDAPGDARRRGQAAHHRRPVPGRDQPRAGGRGGARRVPPGSLLPPQRHLAADPAPARARRRDRAAGEVVRRGCGAAGRAAGAEAGGRGGQADARVRVAGQHPRAAQHDGTGPAAVDG